MTTLIESLWQQYHMRVLNYMHFKTHSDEAEDLTQVVFLQALSAIRKGNGPVAHESGWLWRITNNVLVDYYRYGGRVERRECVELDATHWYSDEESSGIGTEAELVTASDGGTHEQAMARMDQERVRTAVRRLPSDKQRDTVTMRLEGYAFDEVADTLGLTYPAAKQLYQRAAVNLRAHLMEAAC